MLPEQAPLAIASWGVWAEGRSAPCAAWIPSFFGLFFAVRFSCYLTPVPLTASSLLRGSDAVLETWPRGMGVGRP